MSAAVGNRSGGRRRGSPVAASPPRLMQLFLILVLPSGLKREAILGDFCEDYAALRARSRWRARLWYWRQALGVGGRALWSRLRRRTGGGSSAMLSTPAPPGSSPGRPPRRARLVVRCDTVLTHDLPHAVRNLMRAPGFTTVAVLSLALGIAPLAAIGGFGNAMFFRPLPYVQEPERLLALFRGVNGTVAWPDLADASAQADALQDVAGLSVHDNFNLTVGETTTAVMACEVSANYFDLLGIPLALGRGFTADEMGTDATPVVVVSHTFWQRHFDGDSAVLGSVLRIDGTDYSVIGVAPEGLLSPEAPVEPNFYVPLEPEFVESRGRRWLYGVGRMRDGATLDQVRSQLEVVAERLRGEYPRYWSSENLRDGSYAAHPLRALRVRPGQGVAVAVAVGLVATIGLLVLATACSNLGNLLLARGLQRDGEIAVRLALGADRGGLIGMLLTESVLLACIGGGLGVLVAHWLTRLLEAGVVGPGFGIDVTVDARVLAFAAVVTLATGVLFGLMPALHASRPDLSRSLKGDSGRAGRGNRSRLRNVLVVAQVAASLALLVSAGVLLRSLQVMQGTDPGFEPEGVLAVELDLTQRQYGVVEARQFFEQLATRVAAAPGVESVALAVDLPLDGTTWKTDIVPEGIEPEGGERLLVDENRVAAGYFDVMRMPLVAGRTFTAAEIREGAAVVVVNEALQQRFWPDGAVGRRLRVGDRTVQVIGVVRNAAYGALAEAPVPSRLWQPYSSEPLARLHLVVRARDDARAVIPLVRRMVREADPELPVLEPSLMTDVVAWSSGDQRVASVLLSITGAVSLLLVLLGIYGVVSFVVSRRTHEVGLRVALGAQRRDVVTMVLAQGMRLVAVGALAGLLLAFGLAQVFAASFPGVELLDPTAPLLATLLLAGAAALATLVPALRASRVDPMVALRTD